MDEVIEFLFEYCRSMHGVYLRHAIVCSWRYFLRAIVGRRYSVSFICFTRICSGWRSSSVAGRRRKWTPFQKSLSWNLGRFSGT